MAPPVVETFPRGLSVLPDGAQNPVFAVDKHGNAHFSGSLAVDGQFSMSGGGSLGFTLGNNEFLAGLSTSSAVKRLIGVSSADLVSIDTDGLGVLFPSPGTAGTPTIAIGEAGTGFYLSAASALTATIAGTPIASFVVDGLVMASSSVISWALDTTLSRVSAGVLALPTAVTVGTLTGIATAGTIRTAHNNQWLGRTTADGFNRNVIAWGVTTADTVIVGDVSAALAFNASGIRLNGAAGASGTVFAGSTATVVHGIITAIA